MKCFLCTRKFEDKNSLKNQYIAEHKLDPKNWFFKALFEENKQRFLARKCYLCEKFLANK